MSFIYLNERINFMKEHLPWFSEKWSVIFNNLIRRVQQKNTILSKDIASYKKYIQKISAQSLRSITIKIGHILFQ